MGFAGEGVQGSFSRLLLRCIRGFFYGWVRGREGDELAVADMERRGWCHLNERRNERIDLMNGWRRGEGIGSRSFDGHCHVM